MQPIARPEPLHHTAPSHPTAVGDSMQTLTPQSRAAILENPEALECTLYRPDEYDEEAEEQDLGDARIVISGPFEAPAEWDRSEEHTSELQSLMRISYAVFCLKKKKNKRTDM